MFKIKDKMLRGPKRIKLDYKKDENYEERFKVAMEKVANDKVSIRKAAETYGITKSTLSDHTKNKHTKDVGRPSFLSKLTEELIVQTLRTLSEIGFALTKPQTLNLISAYLINTNQENIFPNNIPSDRWYYAFIKRNQEEKVIFFSLSSFILNCNPKKKKFFKLNS